MVELRYRFPALVTASAGLHAAAALAVALAPRHWLPVVATVFADHLLLTGLSFWPQSPWLGANQTRLPPGAAGAIALTFDDGPDPEVTPKVLDLLDRRGARATFFAVGRRVREHAELAAEAVRRGHRVENHSASHPVLFSCFPPPLLRREVEGAQEAIERATGRRPSLFRAPAGFRNPLLDRVLWQAGLALVSWTRRGFDTVERNPARVASRLLGRLAAGDILVLHDGRAARDRNGRPVVLEALPRVLDVLAEKGLVSVPLPALTGDEVGGGEP